MHDRTKVDEPESHIDPTLLEPSIVAACVEIAFMELAEHDNINGPPQTVSSLANAAALAIYEAIRTGQAPNVRLTPEAQAVADKNDAEYLARHEERLRQLLADPLADAEELLREELLVDGWRRDMKRRAAPQKPGSPVL